MKMKIKRLWQNKYFKNYIILLLPMIFLEVVFRLIEDLSIFSYAGLRIFLGLSFVALLFSYILRFLPKLAVKIWNILLILIVTIYGIAELGFNNFIGVYASLQMKTQASAVSSYVGDFIKSFKWTFYLMFIPLILIIIYYILFDKKVTHDLPKLKVTKKLVLKRIGEFLIVIVVGTMYYATLKIPFMQDKIQAITSYELFKKPDNAASVVKEFGYIGFGMLDIKEYFFPGKEVFKIEYDPDKIAISESEDAEHVNIDNVMWKDIIENETNNKYNDINKYLISRTPFKTNGSTGLFENKNLIVIMVESGSNVFLNEEYYPNLSKLYNEGWHWNNYYSPRTSCSTGNNEFSGMTGLYSIYNNCTSNIYKNNTYYESIFNLFNNKGYTTNSFHDCDDTYYKRTTIHKNMGSKSYYEANDMHIKFGHNYGEWASDEDLMEFYLKELDKRDKEKPFMSWITTVTSHSPYNSHGNYNNLYYKDFPDTIASDVRHYMSKLKVVDNAIGILLEGLKTRGILDDTVILLFCDHYPYAIDEENLKTVLDSNISIDNNIDNVPFIIYNTKLESKEFTDYITYVNITPTVANLFNLDYDSRLYMGEDMLSDEYNSIAVFADGSWKNELAFYNAKTNKMKFYTDKVLNSNEILAINEEISLKLKMSSQIIKNNYFNYLNKSLNDYLNKPESVVKK